MKDKNKNIIWKQIINKKFNKTIDFLEKEEAKIKSFNKVKEWLDKQYNLENLELLSNIACQQKKIDYENLEPIHWKKEISNINRNLQNNKFTNYIDLKNEYSMITNRKNI